jgi:hypothetical protein
MKVRNLPKIAYKRVLIFISVFREVQSLDHLISFSEIRTCA